MYPYGVVEITRDGSDTFKVNEEWLKPYLVGDDISRGVSWLLLEPQG